MVYGGGGWWQESAATHSLSTDPLPHLLFSAGFPQVLALSLSIGQFVHGFPQREYMREFQTAATDIL